MESKLGKHCQIIIYNLLKAIIKFNLKNTLAFLDTWSVINVDGSINTKVYGKDDPYRPVFTLSSIGAQESKDSNVQSGHYIVTDESDRVEQKSHVKQALDELLPRLAN